jgi:hypothetical protein
LWAACYSPPVSPGLFTGSQAQASKVVVIVEENEPYESVVGHSQAPYLNAAARLWLCACVLAPGPGPAVARVN